MGKTVVFIVAVLVLAAATLFRQELFSLLNGLTSTITHDSKPQPSTSVAEKVFTKEELKQYRGEKGLYLAILGKVYDVGKGERFYGKDGGYHFFTGLDGTRAFVSGVFTEAGLIEDITGLSHTDILGLVDWQSRYEKDYVYKGKLAGMYYDAEGKPTEALRSFRRQLSAARKEKLADDHDYERFPTCNSQYSQDTGTIVWCSDMSGGTKRSWAGVPRKYFKPPGTSHRCACVRNTGLSSGQAHASGEGTSASAGSDRGDLDNPNLREYDGCAPTSESCKVL